ncbi:MAG: hypothetical protein COA70_06095 [Planctomycetota bacterium]|nr:MAG: hypothetical protein COA70_06095 [Planctomycetota bacterium]
MLIKQYKKSENQSGTVLLLVILITGLLATVTASYSGSIDDRMDIQRDESAALRAEFAAESGLEYAQRRLLLDSSWTGTGIDGLTLSDGKTHFIISASPDPASSYGDNVHVLEVEGEYDDSKAQLGSAIQVFAGEAGTSELALIALGEDFKMKHGMVYGDVLVSDKASKVNDWVFDAEGVGSYQTGGAALDGSTIFLCTGVDGNLYKFDDQASDYQWLGDEIVITENSQAPAWDLDDWIVPGPGKVIFDGVTNMSWEYYDETVVFILDEGEKLVLNGCTFAGGLVVYCPKDYDLRQGYRNLIKLKNQTCVGGGDGGVEPNIGIIAPGGKLANDWNGNWICGFNFVNEIGVLRYAEIYGQTIVLNTIKNMDACEVSYWAPAAENRPSVINFGVVGGYTDMLAVFEDFN